jgi:uncharacterized protein YceH (UPF0502 family)
MHLFGGPIDIDALAASSKPRSSAASGLQNKIAELELRISELENENKDLKDQLENR